MFQSAICRLTPLTALLLSVLFAAETWAATPDEPAQRAAVIGQPAGLLVQPEALMLVGPRARQQVLVTGNYADNTVRDLTAFAEFASENPAIAEVAPEGFLVPKGNGTTNLIVKAGTKMLKVPLTVKDFEKPQPISFRHDLVAAMNVGGCNAGACHGTPSGKNGFKLSLRGFDPAADYVQLTRDVLGRRTSRIDPDASLLLQKALGKVPHEGGQRYQTGSLPATIMRDWMAEGLLDDPETLPGVKGIDVLPGSRVLTQPAQWQQLTVLANFTNNTTRDVTRLTVFSSSDPGIADVTSTGQVEFHQAGEVAILCRYLDQLKSVRFMYLQPRPGFVWPNPAEANYIDKFAFAKMKMLSIPPSDVCSDQEFIRRAYLDVCAILPTPEEVKAFLASKEPDKRNKLVEMLLERPEYADFWTLKWSDVFRSNRKSIQVKGVYVFQHWLRDHLVENTGFDQVVREMLTANGSTFTNPPANYYRVAKDPQNLAETTAQLFFGIRMQCSKCHNHPFERWTQDDYYSMAAFFARVRQKPDPMEPATNNGQTPGAEIIYVDRGGEVQQPRTKKDMPPKFLGGAIATVTPGMDRREALAAWITSADNPFFPKSTVNRIWFHLNGRGIVDPVDDFRDSNPSANDELLDALAKDFVAHKFDIKYLIKTIMASRTYQLSSQTNDFNKDDNKYFSHAVTKLLTAEQLLDAICTVTEVPEKFPGMPAGTRAVQLPDGAPDHPFLKTFGQPARELACECEREGDSNLAQALQLINGATVNEKMRSPSNRISRLLTAKKTDDEILMELALATVSRPPTEKETKLFLAHLAKATDKRKAWEDVQWTFINLKEFLFRH
jgi:hypothetical protein